MDLNLAFVKIPHRKNGPSVSPKPCKGCGNPSPLWYCPVCQSIKAVDQETQALPFSWVQSSEGGVRFDWPTYKVNKRRQTSPNSWLHYTEDKPDHKRTAAECGVPVEWLEWQYRTLAAQHKLYCLDRENDVAEGEGVAT